MEEKTKDKRSLIYASIMLGTYLICAGVVVLYFFDGYPNYDHDRNCQITWSLLTFPTLCLGKIATMIMGFFAITVMGFELTGIGFYLYASVFVILCYASYIFFFSIATYFKNKWLVCLFILWSIVNTTGFLYTKGLFKKSSVDHSRHSSEMRDDGEVRDLRR